jgi:pimeloyl-ACP methyl ester carboxylesterase
VPPDQPPNPLCIDTGVPSVPPTSPLCPLPKALAGWQLLRSKPTLWLYSSADDVVPAAHVEEAIEAARLESGPRLITSHRWPHSPHVGHYRAHSEEYAALCARFLAQCTAETGAGLAAEQPLRA